jgi:NAD(P)-dependent dehydrogenase (short-subunit alcohol dehydrogenase family)
MKRRLRAAVRAFMNPALRLPRPTPPPEGVQIVRDKLIDGRNVLVTGAGGLIGRSLINELIAHGANVWCTELTEALCARLQSQLTFPADKVRVMRADVIRSEDTDALLAALDAEKVTIDLLVNNVGIVTNDFPASFMTNVAGPMYLTDQIAKRMIERHTSGSIVFLTSIHQWSIFTRTRAYAPSKAAVGMLIRQLAVELAPHGIRVNGIAPGDVREDEAGNVVPYAFTPLEGTSVRPQFISRAVVYLASEYFSRYTTGSVITIDGGLSLFNYQCAVDAGLYP